MAVSPGHASKLALVESRCPTFSWGAITGAKGYELVVYRFGEKNEQANPVLNETFAGAINGWTPSVDRCLERGGEYAWSVRAVGQEEATEWSVLSLFKVASGPSEDELEKALEVVQRHLASRPTLLAARDTAPVPAFGGALSSPTLGNRRSGSRVGGVETLAPSSSATPSLVVEDQIHLGAASSIFQDGSVFLWNDGFDPANPFAMVTSNTGLGSSALAANTTGWSNTASGSRALNSNTEGRLNTATGSGALSSNTTGILNTASGAFALFTNTMGSRNTASGYVALFNSTTGAMNTAIGANALYYNTGHRNTAVGYKAGMYATTGSDNIFINNPGMAGDDKKLRIGEDTGGFATYVAGIYGSALTGSNVVVTASGQLGTGPLSGWEKVSSDSVCDTGSTCPGATDCPAGKRVMGGGLDQPLVAGDERATLNRSWPSTDQRWSVEATNISGVSITYRVWAICAPMN